MDPSRLGIGDVRVLWGEGIQPEVASQNMCKHIWTYLAFEAKKL